MFSRVFQPEETRSQCRTERGGVGFLLHQKQQASVTILSL